MAAERHQMVVDGRLTAGNLQCMEETVVTTMLLVGIMWNSRFPMTIRPFALDCGAEEADGLAFSSSRWS